MIRRLAERMAERGIVLSLEVFDFGMVDYAKYLIGRGVLGAPLYFKRLARFVRWPLNLAALTANTWTAPYGAPSGSAASSSA